MIMASTIISSVILLYIYDSSVAWALTVDDRKDSVALKSLHRAFGVKYDASYRVKISTKLVGYVLCGNEGCVDRRLKEELMKCLSREMIDSWFECVRQTNPKALYTDCDGNNYKKMVDCTVSAVAKDPLGAPHNLMDCYENVVSVFAYKCAVIDRFYESFGITNVSDKRSVIMDDGSNFNEI